MTYIVPGAAIRRLLPVTVRHLSHLVVSATLHLVSFGAFITVHMLEDRRCGVYVSMLEDRGCGVYVSDRGYEALQRYLGEIL